MNKFIFNLKFDIFPIKNKVIYLLIFNFDYVRLIDIKRFNDSLGFLLQLLKEFFNFKQIFVKVLAIICYSLRWLLGHLIAMDRKLLVLSDSVRLLSRSYIWNRSYSIRNVCWWLCVYCWVLKPAIRSIALKIKFTLFNLFSFI